jgi:hypothetical protein
MTRRRSYFYHLESAEHRIDRVQVSADNRWTPGQALGEIIGYLDRVEGFTGSNVTACFVQQRMQRLTRMLYSGVRRAQTIGLDPEQLEGVFGALAKHDARLAAERAVTAPSVKAARDMIRLEISYLSSGKHGC